MSKTYKHKNPDFSAPCFSGDNYYLWNVKSNFARLLEIYEGRVSYVPSDFPTLINTFEQLYKGVTKELQALYPDRIKLTEDAYKNGHHFSHYLYIIDKIIPISENRDGFNTIKQQIVSLENLYNPTRYAQHQTIEDFRDAFRKLERGTYRLIEGLKKEMEKSVISEKESDELDLW